MSILITKNWRDQKPPVSSQINFSHPLSQGLVGAWLMNEGGGLRLTNLCNGISSLTVSGTIYIRNKGIYAAGADANEYMYTPTIPRLRIEKPVSVMIKVEPTSDIGFNELIGTNSYTFTNNWFFTIGADESIVFARRDDSTTFVSRTTTAGDIVYKKSTILVATYLGGTVGTGIRIYKDGRELAYTASSNGYVAPTGAKPIWFGGNRWEHTEGWTYFAYVWSNRILQPSEILSLYEAPYQFIQPIRRRIFSIPAGEPPVTEEEYDFMEYSKYW